jgi:hypothetical protein
MKGVTNKSRTNLATLLKKLARLFITKKDSFAKTQKEP